MRHCKPTHSLSIWTIWFPASASARSRPTTHGPNGAACKDILVRSVYPRVISPRGLTNLIQQLELVGLAKSVSRGDVRVGSTLRYSSAVNAGRFRKRYIYDIFARWASPDKKPSYRRHPIYRPKLTSYHSLYTDLWNTLSVSKTKESGDREKIQKAGK